MRPHHALPALALLLTLLAPPAAAQVRYTWDGGNGAWDDPNNWTPAGVPAEADTAVVTAGQASVNDARAVGTLRLSGTAWLTGGGHLTVLDGLDWASGTLNGRDTGGDPTLTIAEEATMVIRTDAVHALRGRRLVNEGTVVWEDDGVLQVQWTQLLENRSGATFDVRGDGQITRTNGTCTFDNAGLLVKSAGTGETVFNWPFGPFNNDGTVRVASGMLRLNNGGGGSGSGAFEALAGATLQVSNGTHTYDAASSLGGAGTLRMTGGTAHFDGAVALTGPTLVSGGTLRLGDAAATSNLAGVALSGGSFGSGGELNVNGLLTWTGGTLGGPLSGPAGVVHLLGGASAEGDGVKRFALGTVNNAATFTWSGTGDLEIGGPTTFDNLEGATFDIRNDARWTRTNGTLQFVNRGLVVKSAGTGTTTIQTPFDPFNNDGEVRVEVGTLSVRISGSGSASTDTGAWHVAEGATLQFGSHQRTFTEEATLSGAGTVDFTDATIVNRGTVRPGLSTGVLAVSGAYPAPQPEGVLEVELGGYAPGTEHDQLAVTGAVTLGGTLRVVLVDGFVPALGDRFLVVPAGGGVSGTFAALDLPDGVEAFVETTAEGVELVIGTVVANEPGADGPSSFALHGAAPNPFAGRTTLGYDVPEAGRVRVAVYDLLGREVAVLVDDERPAGRHEAVLDGTGLAVGVYLVRMTAEGFAQTQRLTRVQ